MVVYQKDKKTKLADSMYPPYEEILFQVYFRGTCFYLYVQVIIYHSLQGRAWFLQKSTRIMSSS